LALPPNVNRVKLTLLSENRFDKIHILMEEAVIEASDIARCAGKIGLRWEDEPVEARFRFQGDTGEFNFGDDLPCLICRAKFSDSLPIGFDSPFCAGDQGDQGDPTRTAAVLAR